MLLEQAVSEGLSQREMARRFDCSQGAVKHWLGKLGLKTERAKHPPLSYDPAKVERYAQRRCKHHGITTFIWEPSKKGYRCRQCRAEKVSRDRRQLKRRLVEEAGGKCVHCGYNKSFWSLHFHHCDPSTKERDIGSLIRDRNYEAAKVEVDKCVLLCANCHGECEAELWMRHHPRFKAYSTAEEATVASQFLATAV